MKIYGKVYVLKVFCSLILNCSNNNVKLKGVDFNALNIFEIAPRCIPVKDTSISKKQNNKKLIRFDKEYLLYKSNKMYAMF